MVESYHLLKREINRRYGGNPNSFVRLVFNTIDGPDTNPFYSIYLLRVSAKEEEDFATTISDLIVTSMHGDTIDFSFANGDFSERFMAAKFDCKPRANGHFALRLVELNLTNCTPITDVSALNNNVPASV